MASLTSTLVFLAFATQALAAPIFVVDRVDNVDNLGNINNAVGCGGFSKKALCCGGSLMGVVHTACVAPSRRLPTILRLSMLVKRLPRRLSAAARMW